MIKIKKSPTADTRTCDWSKVTKEQLYYSSLQHIQDVDSGLAFFERMLRARSWHAYVNGVVDAHEYHDHDKLSEGGLERFHACFKTGFRDASWFENHLKVNRHHIDQPEGVREDVNLIDVLEHIVDCVMAGMARSGSVYPLELPDELLQKAFHNTTKLLKSQVEVE